MSLIVTPSAAARVIVLLKEEQKKFKAPVRLRVSVQSGGCSGFQYHFSFDDVQTADDQVISIPDGELILDDMSLSLLDGSTLDYVEDLIGASFSLKNPNATTSCGCGSSFSV